MAPAILAWGLCGMPFDSLTPNGGSVRLFKLENEM